MKLTLAGKIDLYQHKIRRDYKEKTKRILRTKLINAEIVNQAFLNVIAKPTIEMPPICNQFSDLITDQNLQKFEQLIRNNKIGFRSEGQYPYFLDASNESNLLFIAFASNKASDHALYTNFFKATIQYNMKYASTCDKFSLQVAKHGCIIIDQSNKKPDPSDTISPQRINATLVFWRVYCHTKELNFMSNDDLTIMIKAFLYWHETVEEISQTESCRFIYQMVRIIYFFGFNSASEEQIRLYQLIDMVQTSRWFIFKIKTIVINLMRTGTANAEVMAIITVLIWNRKMAGVQDALWEIICCWSFDQFLITSLQNSENTQKDQGLYENALLLASNLFELKDYFSQIMPTEGITRFLKQIVRLYPSNTRLHELFINVLDKFCDVKLDKIVYFEYLPYKELLQQTVSSNETDILFAYLRAMMNLNNAHIIEKILIDCDIHTRIIKICQQYEEEHHNLFITLVQILDCKLDFMYEKYRHIVKDVVDFCAKMDFPGKETFLDSVRVREEMEGWPDDDKIKL